MNREMLQQTTKKLQILQGDILKTFISLGFVKPKGNG